MTYDRDEWRRPWRPQETVPASGRRSATDTVTPTDQLPHSPGPRQQRTGAADGAGAPLPTRAVPPAPSAPPVAGPAQQRPGRRSGLLIGVALSGLAGAVIGTVVTLAVVLDGDPPAAPDTVVVPEGVSAPPIEVTGDIGMVPAVAEAVTPSVVRIDVRVAGTVGLPGGGEAIGSGVIYRSDGYVLTNHHVIQPAIENELDVTVRLASGDVIGAEIVGSDELNDLAVVRIDRTGLPAINIRPRDEALRVGETVVAIGSPFGLDASVTAGIISALNREIRVDETLGAGLVIPSVIQTDAAINPGNSGGALVDAEGRLIGINTAILTRSGASQGVGFAVSAEQAVSSADQLIEQGFVRHPLLGITGVDVTPEVAEQFGLPASRGAVVESVQSGTGADEADLRPGDIVVEVDGEPLATMSQLVAEVRARAPGDVVVLAVVRDGEAMDVEVVLSERPR